MIKLNLLRTLILGGTDGIITIFNIISSIEGSKLNYKYIFILGLSALFSDAISMATGEYLSIKAQDKTNNKKRKPIENAIVMFISFVIFGSIPLLLYLVMRKINNNKTYINTYLSTIFALFILGILQSKYTDEVWYKSGLNISLYGGSASFISYNISKLISSLF